MQIFVDADACPVVGIVEAVAEKYNIPVTLLCDTNHVLDSNYSQRIRYSKGILIMNIQIFGTKKCNDTKKAERFLRSEVVSISLLI